MGVKTKRFFRAAADALLNDGKCEWVRDSDGHYDTTCGNAWEFMDGGVDDNRARFCMYCGKPISEVSSVWPD